MPAERHLSYGITFITQCYLPPDASERILSQPQPDRPVSIRFTYTPQGWKTEWTLHTQMVYLSAESHPSK